jgi:hypothetical protein
MSKQPRPSKCLMRTYPLQRGRSGLLKIPNPANPLWEWNRTRAPLRWVVFCPAKRAQPPELRSLQNPLAG